MVVVVVWRGCGEVMVVVVVVVGVMGVMCWKCGSRGDGDGVWWGGCGDSSGIVEMW